jgi:uncharacterized protein
MRIIRIYFRVMRLSPRQRMTLHRQMQQWHWISAALCLAALLLFSVTGVTLNHAGSIGAEPEVISRQAQVPGELLEAPADFEGIQPVSAELSHWIEAEFGLDLRRRNAEWSAEEIYISAPGPGRDAWVNIDRATGQAEFEKTSRGVLAWLNDLHKGRNTGTVWRGFIDVVAIACVVFALTGLVLLMLAARQRRATWPTVGAGALVLVLVAIFFAH